MSDLPQRAQLHHKPPAWVKHDSLFFLTICCDTREKSQLDNTNAFGTISNAVDHYIENGKWWVDSFLIMPDHLHALISFPELTKIEKTVRDWKRYVAKQAKVSGRTASSNIDYVQPKAPTRNGTTS
jgi:putative transposase